MVEPGSRKDDALKVSVGTADTERALNLGAAGEKEVQERLSAVDLYTGPKTGALDSVTRLALTQWQKRSGFAPTSFLDSAQLAALKADSETAYQKSLAAAPAIQPAAPGPAALSSGPPRSPQPHGRPNPPRRRRPPGARRNERTQFI